MKLVETTEEVDLRGVLRQLFTTHCPPTLVREQLADAPEFPAALWQELTKVGAFELAVDNAELEGIGTSLDALGIVAEEAGRALCPDVVHSTVLAGLAANIFDAPDEVLEQLSSGDLRVATALWSPRDAHDHRPSLTAEATADGWLISGEITHVWGARHAQLLLTTARTANGPDPARTLILALPTEVGEWDERPAMGGPSTRVRFDRTPISDDQVWTSATPDDLRWLAHAALALQAREIAGGCQAVIDRTVSYVAEREQFGRAIGTFQAVQHLIADMHIATAAVRLAAARATFRVGRGDLATHEVASATMKSSDAYPFVTLTAHQLHGGMGYVRESDLHLWSERAAVLRARNGNSDTAAEWLAEEVGL